jgi:peptide-O-fucosyltransferase
MDTTIERLEPLSSIRRRRQQQLEQQELLARPSLPSSTFVTQARPGRRMCVAAAVAVGVVIRFLSNAQLFHLSKRTGLVQKGDPSSTQEASHQTIRSSEGGYLLFSLTMGRIGNQMEQLLGVLAQATEERSKNRTVVLPPFISYPSDPDSLIFTPVEDVFRLDVLRRLNPNIITMKEFLASQQFWDPMNATIYCYDAFPKCTPDRNSRPFGLFWKAHGVQFTSEYLHSSDVFDLGPKEHPVVVINGAPAPFPMLASDRYVARYLHWSSSVERRTTKFLLDTGLVDHAMRVQGTTSHGDATNTVLVATHIRAGSDWVNACQYGVGQPEYMASPQCAAVMKASGKSVVTEEICLPTANMARLALTLQKVGERIKRERKTSKQAGGTMRRRLVLFVASDVPSVAFELMETYGLNTTYDSLLVRQPSSRNLHEDEDGDDVVGSLLELAVMTRADYFVGNCVSSFTSFAARIRTEQKLGLGTQFFGLDDDRGDADG